MAPERDPRIVSEFKERRTRQLLASIAALFVIFGILWVKRQGGLQGEAYGAVFFAFIILLVAFSFFNWRCPGCKAYLGRGLSKKFCPSCGVPLQ